MKAFIITIIAAATVILCTMIHEQHEDERAKWIARGLTLSGK